jgi:hypothetical protein
MATLTKGASPMFDLKTLTDTPSATSSPAWAGGQLQLDLLDGRTPEKSGRPRARASRSRSPAKVPELFHGKLGVELEEALINEMEPV